MKKFPAYLASWDDIERWAKEGSIKILKENWIPDVVVGLARGGWVAARLYCDYLGIKELVSIKVEHWGVTATPDGKARLKYGTQYDFEGKKVLIVDDIADTGESLTLAKNYIESKNPAEIKVAALLVIKTSKFRPDYFGEEIDWAWIVFPWNFVEDMINLVNNLFEEKESLTSDEIIELFKELHGMEVPKDKLEEALKFAQMRKIFKSDGQSWRKA
ncbi:MULTISPECIES: phosphoribosyltransferase [Thermococcus]|uniref:Phosphoribosyl transferase domain protein n=2 Tax=Thermococcus sibiricus TaxID=172049 RepID=C6A0U9_THESM|nr:MULTISPECIES: phosphoribosyltransferase [Thermococcus]KUK27978.1 MAG: Phosphoribosyl transferase domain protein [Thermococcus sp. 40_45]HII67607.1 phosphoribosyltransferase [Thermococcaceae archaeon]ACS89244.1 Phosphoribosyl transferase domain protein [Thermococcus sibiricus MM 739]KUK17095.1 MAG: Phosphoribosyl transferase domain protein [Thermococcus sibiricus]MBC7095982.1 phosphoribosyltransferase [Thermococcus sp.]